MRVLIMSPGHPALGGGGAERASYSLFRALRGSPSVSAATFVARAESSMVGHLAAFGCFRGRQDEIMVQLPPVDGFSLQSLDPDALAGRVRDLLLMIKPDLVHVHHMLGWGVEVFEVLASMGVKVVFTLHEFRAMCNRDGQMVKTNGELCYAASPAECAACFPDRPPGKFFIRERLLKHFLGKVDFLVSPSRFLARRFSDWGMPESKIRVIENVLDPDHLIHARTSSPSLRQKAARRTIIGYFGQITPYKGVDVLLEACVLMSERERECLDVRIYGDNVHWRNTGFGRRLSDLQAQAPWVSLMGSFQNESVLELMSRCEWIVVPSIWWENSPVVIQEAKLAGVPLIASDIGGVSEKLDPETDILVPARSIGALASALSEVALGRQPARRPSSMPSVALEQHIDLFGELVRPACVSTGGGIGRAHSAKPRREHGLPKGAAGTEGSLFGAERQAVVGAGSQEFLEHTPTGLAGSRRPIGVVPVGNDRLWLVPGGGEFLSGYKKPNCNSD